MTKKKMKWEKQDDYEFKLVYTQQVFDLRLEEQNNELIGEFLEKIKYYLKTDDCDPIAYFIKVKEEYEKRIKY